MIKLKDRLVKMNACREAVEWVGDRDLKTAWAECERADWMLWFASGGSRVDQRKIVMAACECARRGLKYVPAGEDRPRLAIEAAERWAKKPTWKNKASAASAAHAAYSAYSYVAYSAYASAASAAHAAYSAYSSAASAAAAAYSAYSSAAHAAYSSAAHAAANAAELKIMADIVRKYIKVSVLRRNP